MITASQLLATWSAVRTRLKSERGLRAKLARDLVGTPGWATSPRAIETTLGEYANKEETMPTLRRFIHILATLEHHGR